MPKTVLLAPLFGALGGYFGAITLGVTDGLWIFLIAVLCMIGTGVAGLVLGRRRGT